MALTETSIEYKKAKGKDSELPPIDEWRIIPEFHANGFKWWNCTKVRPLTEQERAALRGKGAV